MKNGTKLQKSAHPATCKWWQRSPENNWHRKIISKEQSKPHQNAYPSIQRAVDFQVVNLLQLHAEKKKKLHEAKWTLIHLCNIETTKNYCKLHIKQFVLIILQILLTQMTYIQSFLKYTLYYISKFYSYYTKNE